MTAFLQSLTFATPLALAGLALLPLIWWLLRFTPPRPQTVRFPPLRLLLDLVNREEQPDKTPLWLMLLRLAIAALVILGVSSPAFAPGGIPGPGSAPLLIIVDNGWPAAKDWDRRRAKLIETLQEARVSNVPVSLATTVPESRPSDLSARDAAAALASAQTLEPVALTPDRPALLSRLQAEFGAAGALRIIWLSDGLDHGTAASFATGLRGLSNGGASVDVLVPEAASIPRVLSRPEIDGGRIRVTVMRAEALGPGTASIRAVAANGRTLADMPVAFGTGARSVDAGIELPIELRNEVQRLEIDGERSAAAVYLFDDRWRRKSAALMTGASIEDAQPLLSPLYYASRALEPYAEISEPADPGQLRDRLESGLSMLVLADIGVLSPDLMAMIDPWLQNGGLLLRFAGPRLAGAQDTLIPVTLREGGRSLGSALSWETPQSLQDFAGNSPFAGLARDAGVTVSRQVLAEPDASLPEKVWASLSDGTPLVTAERRGKGLIVLFHVTANADWSNLPLTGLFVDMMRRVLDLAPGAGGGASAGAQSAADLAAAFTPRRALAGTGDLADPLPDAQPIAARDIDGATPSPRHPAGLYTRGAVERSINLASGDTALTMIGDLPSGVARRSFEALPSLPFAPYLFAAAALLFLLDTAAAFMLGGGLQRLGRSGASAAVMLVLLLPSPPALAQDADDFAMKSTLETRLAFVLTGNADVDRVSDEGLRGLSAVLADRTSVIPGEPMGINLERDDIVFFPLLYWPVVPEAPLPSDTALARVDAFMKNGGTIVFDLRESGFAPDAFTGGGSAGTQALRALLGKLDIPPLEPVPADHVLTKTFYLMQDFPGRYDRGQLWVERLGGSEAGSGNADGVSSIIIGSNDYAAAWAMDSRGQPLYATVPGGERQRELSYRVGINLVMYALTGNYKADQVHVPALLERLGQ